ncbi:MAG: glycosyltransferase family 2 protein [Planctomycetes bacterium]|nr:glycosyltransferase family 2 protein [Planctomycetota bacterium]
MRKHKFTMADLAVKPGRRVGDAELPKVCVVILNLNGRHHLERCFESLAAMDYPKDKLDVLLIDNGSDDGSVEECRKRWPWVRLEVNPRNVGFAPGCNQGARLRGDASVLAFLNNDIRVDRGWLRELVQPIARGEAAATGSKMLSWDGKTIDSAGGGVNFHGIGLAYGYKDVPSAEHDVPRKTLFACGGAMAMDARTFDEVGGFDNEFFAYYEDVDLGWRTWVLGHEVHYVPSSVCWHHHHGTSKRLPLETVRLIQVRNPLYACFKNYDDEHLRKILPVALALFLRRMLIVSGIPSDQPFRIEKARTADTPARPSKISKAIGKLTRRPAPGAAGYSPVTSVCAADLIAANDLLANWEHWMQRRAEVQSRRKRADQEIFRLFLRPMWCIEDDPQFKGLLEGSAEFFGVTKLFEGLTLMTKDPAK